MTLVVGAHMFGAVVPPDNRRFAHVSSSARVAATRTEGAFEQQDAPAEAQEREPAEAELPQPAGAAKAEEAEEDCRSPLTATAGGRWEGVGSRSWVPADAYCGPLPSVAEVVERAREVVTAAGGRRVRLVIMGDSQGGKLGKAVQRVLGCSCPRRGSRCKDAERFAGIKAVPPSVDVKVPEHDQRTVRNCQACKGCDSRGCSCTEAAVDVDYLGMEYSKDNEQTSARYEWTQEVWLKEYLLEKAPPDMLVLNTGLHDVRRWDADEYEANIRWIMGMAASLSEKHGTEILWLQTTLPNKEKQPEKWRNFTSVESVEQYNERAARIMAAARVPIADTAAMSVPSAGLHVDGVHLKPVYYDVLSRIVLFDLLSRRLERLRAAA